MSFGWAVLMHLLAGQSLARCQLHGSELTFLIQTDARNLSAAQQLHLRITQRLLKGIHPNPAPTPDQMGRFIVRACNLAVEQQGGLLRDSPIEDPVGTQKALEHRIAGAAVERLLEIASPAREGTPRGSCRGPA